MNPQSENLVSKFAFKLTCTATDWKKLGLKSIPTIGENGVHASASPLEVGGLYKLNSIAKLTHSCVCVELQNFYCYQM